MNSILDFPEPDWDNINSISIMKGEYEILFATCPEDEEGNNMAVQWIQGASVKMDRFNLSYEIHPKKNEAGKNEGIESVSFTMPDGDFKLGDLFNISPYGLIKKNRTGIGATTLELLSKRNSIIVVPTKALAYNKAKISLIEGTDKYATFYIGSPIEGFKQTQSLDDYFNDDKIINKKFIVVADSLPRLLDYIKEENFKNYFLMIDEIDSYQYDSTYRPELEKVIDHYFTFPSQQRCLVSATVGNFTNPKIQKEPVIYVNFTLPQIRNIELVHTTSIHKTLIDTINLLLNNQSNEKILIAYNSIRDIELIIKNLSSEYQNDCAVLCSPKSKPYVENYYSEPIDNQLPKRINFMTCTYFVGIDITERFHLISIADPTKLYTLLSLEKLQQISGRCRRPEGLLSETIIYTTINEHENEHINLKETEKVLLKDSEIFCDFANSIAIIKEKFPELNLDIINHNKEDLINGSAKRYFNLRKTKIVRTNISGNFIPAYFNIDAILIQLNLCENLYKEQNKLKEALLEEGHKVLYKEIKEEITECRQNQLEQVKTNHKKVHQNEIEQIIQKLKQESDIRKRKEVANTYKTICTKHGSTFIERVLELHKYVPFDKLTEILPSKDHPNKYKNFYNSVIFWALAEDHSFKITIKTIFPIGSKFTNSEIEKKLNDILKSNLLHELKNRQCVTLLTHFCKTTRINDRNVGNLYKILDYDINNFNCSPTIKIQAGQNLQKLFRF